MSKKLRISEDLQLPLDAQTSTVVVYGGKGMGKTNLGSVLVEEYARAALRFSVIDPMGVWWGLQHGADKKRPGIECLLLGGVHGDIPIEPTAGAVIADLVADESVSTVIDISRHSNGKMWSIGERIRFVADFCIRLYERQGERRIPLHLLIDEAARFAPQEMRHGEVDVARCYSALAVIVEEGRNVGIGITLMTQRSARLAKAVSELADCMIAFRTVGPRSVGAIMDWLGEHVEKARHKTIVEQLRKLPRGQALVVSPGWLDHEGIVQIRPRETFDSSATPKPGHELRAPGKATKPDLDKYRERMVATIEKAKADDPRELRRQILELQKKVAAGAAARPVAAVVSPSPATKIKTIEKPVVGVRALKGLHQSESAMRKLHKNLSGLHEQILLTVQTDFGNALAKFTGEIEKLTGELGKVTAVQRTNSIEGQQPAALVPGTAHPRSQPGLGNVPRTAAVRSGKPEGGNPVALGDGSDLSRPQLRILEVLAWFDRLGVNQVKRETAAVLSGVSPTSSGFEKNIGRLRTLGCVDYPVDGFVALTDDGRGRIGEPPEIRGVEELHQAWLKVLPRPQGAILELAVRAWPEALPKEEVATLVNVSPTSSGFEKNLGRLRSLGAVVYPAHGQVRASDLLFPEALLPR